MGIKNARKIEDVLTTKKECEKLEGYIQDCDIPNIKKLRKNQIKKGVDYNKCPYDMIGKRFDYVEVLSIEPEVETKYYPKGKPYYVYYYYVLCHKCGKVEKVRRGEIQAKELTRTKSYFSCPNCRNIYKFSSKKINEVFNNWKVLRIHHSEKDKNNRPIIFYECECVCCGERRILTSKQTKHNFCKKRIQENRAFLEKKKENIIITKIPKKVRNLIGKVTNEITIIGFGFIDLIKKRYWVCQCGCGNLFYCNEDTFMSSKSRVSCGCKNSRGEAKIKHFLLENNIKFTEQFKTSKCKRKTFLPFDFKIFYSKKKYFLLEYQGQQHYEATDFSSECPDFLLEDKLLEIQDRDAIKRAYCKKNNIELFEIPYWDYDNIEEILVKKLHIK